MTIAHDDSIFTPLQLRPSELLDEDQLGPDINIRGYSPPDWSPAELSWGFIPSEARTREPLSARLSREVPEDVESPDLYLEDGERYDSHGEPVGPEAGDSRAGRIVQVHVEHGYAQEQYWGVDIGIDDGAATAEESAIHIVTLPRLP